MQHGSFPLKRVSRLAVALLLLAGCSKPAVVPPVQVSPVISDPAQPGGSSTPSQGPLPVKAGGKAGSEAPAVQPVPDPEAITVLVNKRFKLPADYRPDDLVEPRVAFIFQEKVEKRLMRKEAARALELLFAAAEKDGIHLAGVSGFRSYETQKVLFAHYVRTQGEEVARKYSAEPGHSEHQTGLAMDLSGSTGACAVEDCFADTPEAKWLAAHAAERGFIIRYPRGKESITGYNYEPWHLRYVGAAVSRQIAARGVTLEEYLGQAP
ncbi:MAG: M15 family metallopeptidase [Bacillota bacterium]